MGDPTRRRVLAATGPALVAGLAGCSSARGDGTTSTTTETTTETTGTTETTESTTETTDNADKNLMSTVFHFSSKNAQDHAVANVKNLLADDTVDLGTVTLVANGGGVSILTTDSSVAKAIEKLGSDGVHLRACHNSMDKLGYTQSDLLQGVEPVPSGVGELTKRQAAGDAYIKTP